MTDRLISIVQSYVPNVPLKIISQGAEALVFETSVHPYSNSPSLDNKNNLLSNSDHQNLIDILKLIPVLLNHVLLEKLNSCIS